MMDSEMEKDIKVEENDVPKASAPVPSDTPLIYVGHSTQKNDPFDSTQKFPTPAFSFSDSVSKERDLYTKTSAPVPSDHPLICIGDSTQKNDPFDSTQKSPATVFSFSDSVSKKRDLYTKTSVSVPSAGSRKGVKTPKNGPINYIQNPSFKIRPPGGKKRVFPISPTESNPSSNSGKSNGWSTQLCALIDNTQGSSASQFAVARPVIKAECPTTETCPTTGGSTSLYKFGRGAGNTPIPCGGFFNTTQNFPSPGLSFRFPETNPASTLTEMKAEKGPLEFGGAKNLTPGATNISPAGFNFSFTDAMPNFFMSNSRKDATTHTEEKDSLAAKKDDEKDILEGLNKLSQDFKDLFFSGEDSDIILKVSSREFKVHKAILKARCPLLAAKFANNVTGENEQVVEISDYDSDAFYHFLQYVYSGKVETLSLDQMPGVYEAAHAYDAKLLKTQCVNFMMNNISVDNVCKIMGLALEYEESRLREEATKFFSKNLKEIIVTEQWLCFQIEHLEESNKLLFKALDFIRHKEVTEK